MSNHWIGIWEIHTYKQGLGGTDTMYVIRMPPKNPQNKQQIKNIRTRDKKNQITNRYKRKNNTVFIVHTLDQNKYKLHFSDLSILFN